MSVGTVKWENFKITYKRKWDGQDEPDEQDEVIELGSPGGQDGQDGQDEPEAPWMFDIYDVWYRDPRQVIHNLLRHADIKDKMDFIPYWEFNATSDQRHWEDFMLGDWAWDEADKIISDNPLDCEDGADEPTASFEEDPGDMDDSPMSVEAHLIIEQTCARNTRDLATELNIPHLLNILCCFLQSQLQQDDHDPEDVPLDECPFYDGCIHVYNSASLTFYAPVT
ncbi:hypothetical protein M404DRAFT_29264 [Pisolithus tinctorius Marx 270]|uniref:Uncharacterized protein n=1 Tax=Pisolithus tinctorius Marx 270 TaxID=870435 RepID=A0A0C3P0M9_PISTI|nr:hypothetical protein M404DRAFT_29264 [Pisolithus tinctorius Marx 270]